MAVDPQSVLRAINAPPALGHLSAAQSLPYLVPGIGVGPGNMMAPKDAQGIMQAAANWQRLADQQGGGAGRFNNIVIGDTPGQAYGNLLNLRAQDMQAAFRAAEMDAQRQLREQAINADYQAELARTQAYRDRAMLEADTKRSQIAQQAEKLRQDQAKAERDFQLKLAEIMQKGQGGLSPEFLERGQQLIGTRSAVANDLLAYQDAIERAAMELAAANQSKVSFTAGGVPVFDRPEVQSQFASQFPDVQANLNAYNKQLSALDAGLEKWKLQEKSGKSTGAAPNPVLESLIRQTTAPRPPQAIIGQVSGSGTRLPVNPLTGAPATYASMPHLPSLGTAPAMGVVPQPQPQPQPVQPQTVQPQMILVRSPDGRIGYIPSSSLQQAIARGAVVIDQQTPLSFGASGNW